MNQMHNNNGLIHTNRLTTTIKQRIVCTLAIIIWSIGIAQSADFKAEQLNYRVLYKWGLVNKTAGRAKMSLKPTDSGYRAILTARSEPWADRVYHLRDTLVTVMDRQTLRPSRYEKIAHEDGKYSRDIIEFTYLGNNVTGKCTRYRRGKKDATVTTAHSSLTATESAYDMLSVFYYIRSVDFASLGKNNKVTVTIFSGKKKETLSITYKGTEKINVSSKIYNTHHVTFSFTNGGKKSSEPIKAWLSDDYRKIPIKLEGQLKIGKVIVEYTGG